MPVTSGVSRRSVVHGALAGAAGLAVAPWRRASAAQDATPGSEATDAAWYDLANRLQGRLLRPGDIMYEAATAITSTRYSAVRPRGIAICVAPEDAAACVRWARDTGTPFAILSGGHNYAGYSTTEGLIIDVKGMRDVVVDPARGTVTAAGGANNADMGEALAPYGVYVPGGRCPSVGVSGLTLGGGWGFSCRHLGLTCDNLISTEMVTANGQIVTASESENADLFWAVRGAAGGNYGVHTSFTYHAYPTSDVTVVSLTWEGGDAGAVIDAICRAQLASPRELGLRVGVRSLTRMPSSQPAPLSVNLLGIYWGPPAEAEELLAPIARVQAPHERTVQGMGFPAARNFLIIETPTGPFGLKSGFVSGAPSAEAIETMLSWVTRMPGVPSRLQESTASFFCWGGKVRDVAPDAMAFVHRDADFLFKCEALWEPQDDPDLVVENLDWLEGLHAAMRPYLTGGAYQNFPDRSQENWLQAYYGANLDRLKEVKRTWDPDNVFRYGQSIPVG